MNEKIIAVVNQPTVSSIIRSVYYMIFGGAVITFLFTNIKMVEEILDDNPPFIIVIILGYIFAVLGIVVFFISIFSMKLKEIRIVEKDGKISFNRHILKTALFSQKNRVEMNTKNLKIKVKIGNPFNTHTWYKILFTSGTEKYKLIVFKFASGSIQDIKDYANKKGA